MMTRILNVDDVDAFHVHAALHRLEGKVRVLEGSSGC